MTAPLETVSQIRPDPPAQIAQRKRPGVGNPSELPSGKLFADPDCNEEESGDFAHQSKRSMK